MTQGSKKKASEVKCGELHLDVVAQTERWGKELVFYKSRTNM